MRRLLGLAAVASVCATSSVLADDGLQFGGSVRLRYETLSGQARPNLSPTDQLASLRTMLFSEYRSGLFWFGGELWDSRAYGGTVDGSVGPTDVNALEIAQAYAGVDMPELFGASSGMSLQAGRLVFNLGSRRLVAADDYRNTATTMTGLRADVVLADWSSTLIYMLPNIHRPEDKRSVLDNTVAFDRESFDLVLWGGILTKARVLGDAVFDFSYFHLQEQDGERRPSLDRSLNTLGPRIIRPPQPSVFDGEIEAFYQFGTESDGLAANARKRDVSASFIHADLGYTFKAAWQPRLSIEYDRASGDGGGGLNTHFDTLFGMRRAELAPYGIYGAIGRANIETPAIRLEVTPSDRFDWFLNYRVLWLAGVEDAFSTSGVRDPTGNSGRFAGQQIEGRMRYWLLPKKLLFELDAVLLLKGRFLKEAPNAPPTGDTHYLSFNLSTYF